MRRANIVRLPAPAQYRHRRPILLDQRGYGAAYHPGENTRCPGCHRRQWYVGRITAECAHCATALPIVSDGRS